MTDSSTLNSPQESTQPNSVTSVTGGVNLDAGRVDVGGDVVGRDKVQSTGRDMFNLASGATLNYYAPAEAVRTGLSALGELMQRSPEVRIDLIAFQTNFRAAGEQIKLLGSYKDLHDLLHDLQFHCYNSVVQAAQHFPGEVNDLKYHIVTLDGIIAKLREVIERKTLPQSDTSWIDDVVAARKDLKAALKPPDRELLEDVIWRLSRLLNTWPTLINKSLIQAARELKLLSLTEALTRICDRLPSHESDAGKIKQIEQGTDDLRQRAQGLMALVEEHDRWQMLDLELRRIEGTLDRDFRDLKRSWPLVKADVDRLCANATDEWIQDLKDESQNLDEQLAANNPPEVVSGFGNFRHGVSVRFFQVDKNLKAMCDELRQIGGPLALLLEMSE